MVKRIVIANGIVWLLELAWRAPSGQSVLIYYGGLSVEGVLQGYLWQPFTYMWLHSTQFMHILFNMVALWMFGGQLEQLWGSRRFLNFYLTCGIGAGFFIFVWNLAFGNFAVPTVGASGAIFGVLTAFSLLWPNQTIWLVIPPIPLRAIYFIPLLFVMQFIMGGGNISHAGHLGGVLVGGYILRDQLRGTINLKSLRYRWHRYRMKGRLRSVRREEWERRKRPDDDDDDRRPTYH